MTAEKSLPQVPTIRLQFEHFPTFVAQYTSYLSLGGMFLETADLHAVGSRVSFDLRLSDGFRLVQGSGEVVWVRPTADAEGNGAGMALRFQALDEKGRELILKILEEQVKGGGQPFDVDEIPPGVISTPGEGAVPTVALSSPAPNPQAEALEFSTPWESLPEVPAEILDEGGDAQAVFATGALGTEPEDTEPEDTEPEDTEMGFELESLPSLELEEEPVFGEPDVGGGEDDGFDLGSFEAPGLDEVPLQELDDDDEPTLMGIEAVEVDVEVDDEDDEPTFVGHSEVMTNEAMTFGTVPEPSADGVVVDIRDPTRERSTVDPMPTASAPLFDSDPMEDGEQQALSFADPTPDPGGVAIAGVGFGGEGGVGDFGSGSFASGTEEDAMAEPTDGVTLGAESFGPLGGGEEEESFELQGAPHAADPVAYDPTASDPDAYDPMAYEPNSQDPGSQDPGSYDPGAYGSEVYDSGSYSAEGWNSAAGESFGSDVVEPGGVAADGGGAFGNGTEILTGGSPPASDPGAASPFDFGADESPAESTLSLEPPSHVHGGYVDYEDDLHAGPKRGRGPAVRLTILLVLIVAAVLGFLFRAQLGALLGLTTSDSTIPVPGASEPETLTERGPGASEAAPTETFEPATDPAMGVGSVPPPKAPERAPDPLPITAPDPGRSADSRPSQRGRPAHQVVDISWSEPLRGTEVVVCFDGSIDQDRLNHLLLEYDPKVEQVTIHGIDAEYHPSRQSVGTPAVREIRAGLHDPPSGLELRIVVEFPTAGPSIRDLTVEGDCLRILVR